MTRKQLLPLGLGLLAMLAVVALILGLAAGGHGDAGPVATPCPTPMDTPSSTPVGTPSPASLTQVPFSYETTGNPNISETDTLGEARVDYPVSLSPESSDSVFLFIYVPAHLASLRTSVADRVEIPDDVPRIIGEPHTYLTTIPVVRAMRAELSSPSLDVDSQCPRGQYVNTQPGTEATRWSWSIRAPDTVGQQVFTLSIYLGQDEVPVWIGSFKVEVVRPTDTPKPAPTPGLTPTQRPSPTPTPTPRPLVERVTGQLIENAATVLGAILTFIAAMTMAYAQYNKRRAEEKIEKLEEKVDELSKESKQEQQELVDEIDRLKSIRWWQLWRR